MRILQERNMARIEVQKQFCLKCAQGIKRELQKIEDIANIDFYPENTMVKFSFSRANELAMALNTLTKLGYPEVGEISPTIQNHQKENTICNC